MDIDIPLTPFTNSLPVNRLKLSPQNEKVIKVLYFDILAGKITALDQKYKRLSFSDYQYENVTNDFEAIISVDKLGLVKNYPALFERTFITGSHHAA
ncbi:MAG: putative glycolipid-binding domain-containing protein [Ferruginibacter sp.]